ncbi:MAG: hypothetical protein IT473_00535 [Lysobacter sp.]|nr:hypothetical protein [Lysobacter sp.]
MKTARGALREELTATLLPELRRLGFEGPSRIDGRALVYEFSRRDGDIRHVLTLQLEKRGLPRFVLGLALEPPEGFAALTARGGTTMTGQLRPRRDASVRGWFRADPTLWQRLRGDRASRHVEAVAACVALLPEVESWWRDPKSSAHIVAYPVRFPGTAAPA